MKLELANFVLDRVSMYVAPIRQPQVQKHERNWSFKFESGKLQLGPKKREPCGIQHNARHPASGVGGLSLEDTTDR